MTRLVTMINEFDDRLDKEHEVGLRLVNFGQTFIVHLEDVGFWDPSLLWFKGKTEDDNPVEIIQHVTQISIALMVLPRKNTEEPKKKIGFHNSDSEAAKQSE